MTAMSPSAILTPAELGLVDRWQRGFPLDVRPYAAMADEEGMSEADILGLLERLVQDRVLARVGATVRPNTAGASMLAAMRVPPDRVDEVAAVVNREPTVNHNYEREHEINLWFVLTGASQAALAASLARIRTATGCDVLELPLERAYFIDLGFGLTGGASRRIQGPLRTKADHVSGPTAAIDDSDRRLLAILADGLPLTSRPYAELAARLGLTEGDARERIGRLLANGIITRLGLIVRHRTLGFRANAMAVWDVPDDDVERVGQLFAAQPFVTLCYRRPRRLPDWPYNLFCMVHGLARDSVAAQVSSLTGLGGLERHDHAMLFSRRCFLQRGARLAAE